MLIQYSDLLHMYVLYIYNGGALWWSIYNILIGHMSATTDWLIVYTGYSMVNAYAYIYLFMITTIHSILLLLIKK